MNKYIISTRLGKQSFKVHYLSANYICKDGELVRDSQNLAHEAFPVLTEEQIKDRGGTCRYTQANRDNHTQYGAGNYPRR